LWEMILVSKNFQDKFTELKQRFQDLSDLL